MDCLASINGGIARFITSQPFDCMRITMQTMRTDSLTTSIKTVYSQYGLYGFYRGGVPFFWGNLGATMLQWNTYFYFTKEYNLSPITSGLVAGAAGSMLSCPMERLRILKITNQNLPLSLRFVPLWQGWRITCIRDALGYAAFFKSYQLLKDTFPRPSFGEKILTGSVAGICLWTIMYPFDTVKTAIQANKDSVKIDILSAIKNIYQRGGVVGFFRGFSTCLLRAIPVNVSMISAVDITNEFLHVTKFPQQKEKN